MAPSQVQIEVEDDDDEMEELVRAEMLAEEEETNAAQNLAEVFNSWGEDEELLQGVVDELDKEYVNRKDVCWQNMTVVNPKQSQSDWTNDNTKKWPKKRGTKHRAGTC
jgi:hypothetical protein